MTSSTAAFGPDACAKIQSMSPPGPAMKPSTDIVTCQSTLPIDRPPLEGGIPLQVERRRTRTPDDGMVCDRGDRLVDHRPERYERNLWPLALDQPFGTVTVRELSTRPQLLPRAGNATGRRCCGRCRHCQ